MNIAIWGAGKFGRYICTKLKEGNDAHIVCFIDSCITRCEEKADGGVPVVSPMIYAEKYAIKTDLVLIAFSGSIAILKQLEALEIKRFGFVAKRVYTYKLPLCKVLDKDPNIIFNDDDILKGVCMETLETNVVDCCNLNCKGCSHFSNLFSKDSKVPFEVFESDIKRLSEKVFILQFNLLGGEALLSDRLVDYILCLKRYMPKTKVEIVTNGLLIPYQKEEVLNCIRENDVAVNITEYPPTTVVLGRIREVMQKYDILYAVRPLVENFGKNIDVSGDNDPKLSMLNCRESKCQFLREGKLFKCPFAALGNYFFEHYEIPIYLHDCVDIYDETIDWENVIGKLCNEPIEACRYCGKEERFSWGRSDNPLKEEWLL